jgi:hypothetical protein
VRIAGFVWTLPNTVLGVVVGLLTFQRPRLVEGAVLFDRAPRGPSWILLKFNRVAMTLGIVVIAGVPLQGTLLRHELHHVRQYRAWGPLFIPVYLILFLLFGYRRHPFEVAAMRAAGEQTGDPGASPPANRSPG